MDVILVDGKNYSYRHGFTRTKLRTSTGHPTGVLFGALVGLMRLHKNYPNAAIVFCWDGSDTDNSWRHKLAKTYKSTRKSIPGTKKPPEVIDIHKQIPILKKQLREMGFRQFEIPQLEADDLIGIFSEKLKSRVERVLIYSTDKDFFQLMRENVYVIRDLDKAIACRPLKPKQVFDRYGVMPKHWLRFRALTGDSSDNIIKPVKGVGPKTALKMLAEGCNPSSKECCIEKLKPHWEAVRLNYSLSRIIRKLNDKRLPEHLRQEVKDMVMQIKLVKDLYRDPQFHNRSGYKRMMKFCRKYELEELLNARTALWGIK